MTSTFPRALRLRVRGRRFSGASTRASASNRNVPSCSVPSRSADRSPRERTAIRSGRVPSACSSRWPRPATPTPFGNRARRPSRSITTSPSTRPRAAVAGDGHRCAFRPQCDRPRNLPAITFDRGGDARRLDETPDSREGRMSRTIAARAPGAGTIPRPWASSRRLDRSRTVRPPGCGRGRRRRVTGSAGRRPRCWRPVRP